VPSVSADRQAVEFITDYLRLIIGGNFDAMQLESLMDMDIAAYHEQAEVPSSALAKVADNLPAFGVVAAMMGVVVTMGALNGPPEALGQFVGAALVGALLGVVLAYGFVGPLSGLLELRARESAKFLEVIKVTLIASLNGYDPATATEFGRKVVYADDRPSFREMESHLRQKRG
jgi:chemotaxis protein MotA